MKKAHRKVKVLIVDDSAVFRELLSRGLMTDPDIEVVAMAKDPFEATQLIVDKRPDVMTCDVEMPRMNGVEFIRRLLPQHPMPVIVVSTVSAVVLDALSAGAVDFVTKPGMGAVREVERFLLEMIRKVKAAVHSKPIMHPQGASASRIMNHPEAKYGRDGDLIVIGASTGGTEAIYQLIKRLPSQLPAIAIVQHILPTFSRMFAERLNAITPFRVKEARNGDVLERGTVLISPGDQHLRVVSKGGRYVANCFQGERVNGHRPSVDVLFESAAKHAGDGVIGVLLTGMGYDGARGLLAIRRKGGRTIGQDEATSVIYGMPRVAYEVGAVEHQLPLHQIAAKICSLCNERQ